MSPRGDVVDQQEVTPFSFSTEVGTDPYAGNAASAQLMLSERRAELDELGSAIRRLKEIARQPDILSALRQEAARFQVAAAVDSGPEASAPPQVRSALSVVRIMLAQGLNDVEKQGRSGSKPTKDLLRAFILKLEQDYQTGLAQLPRSTGS